jgi:hypothetical protein
MCYTSFAKNEKIFLKINILGGCISMSQTEVKLIELGRKFLNEGKTDSEVLEQMKLLIDFALYLLEIDLKHERENSEAVA